MADNVSLNPGIGGSIIATDDIGGIQYQRVKLTLGIDGVTDGDVSSSNPIPANISRFGGSAVAIGQGLMVASIPVVIASNQSNLPVVLQTGSNVIGALVANQSVNMTQIAGVALTLGQKTMAASIPIAIASDQSTLNASLVNNGLISAIGTNSTNVNLGVSGVFVGVAEDVSQYAEARISIFADQASAVDGLSLQQSSNGTNWDITDSYSITASQGKTLGVGISAQFFRLVYTNGVVATTNLRIQVVYHKFSTKPSSTRPQDGRTNENDFEENTSMSMLFNGTSWDRGRSAIATMNSAGTGLAAAAIVAQVDDVSPQTITENNFGHVRMNSNRALHVMMAPHHGLIGDPFNLTGKTARFTTAQTGGALWTPASGKKIVITKLQMQIGGTTAGEVQIWFGASGDTTYSRGTDLTIFDGEFAPSATNKPGVVADGPWISPTADFILRVTTSSAINPLTITVWGYEL